MLRNTEGRDLNDTEILAATTRPPNDKGQVQFRITLPSGREMKSEWMIAEESKKGVIPWLEYVREQVDVDRANQEALKSREMDTTSVSTAEESSTKEDSSQSPIDYVTQQRDTYRSVVERLEHELKATQNDLAEARDNLEDWQKIVDSLRGEIDE